MGDRHNAVAELARIDGTRLDPSARGVHQYLTALLALDGGRLPDAFGAIQRAIAAEPARPQYYITSGEILKRLGEHAKAVQQWEQALRLRPDLPAAHFALGTHYYRLHNASLARQSLEKAIYYDNRNSSAAVLLESLRQQRFIPLEQIQLGRALAVRQKLAAAGLACQVGETLSVDFELVGVTQGSNVFITALEPYGFGVQAEVGEQQRATSPGGQSVRQFKVKLHGSRPDRANLGKPWEVNLVAVDLTTGAFADHRLRLSVREQTGEEGRVLLVITQDHEQTSGFGQASAPPGVPHVTATEARTELVEKLGLANELAHKQGVRWSHIVDIGSAVLRLKWEQLQAASPEWQAVWPATHQALLNSLAQGHDVQLHIHGYNLPGNRLSRQYFDPASQTIRFEDKLSRKQGSGESHGSWADNFTEFGTWTEKDSRVGSLFQGLQLLEGELHAANPDYSVLFFRAGEYEFGRDKAAVAASIQALRMNRILAGSDAHEGSPYRRDFKFHRPVGHNVYFTASDSIDEPAASLLDVGILEMLPVPERFGHDHLSPLSALRSVQENYQRCLDGNTVRSGLFLMLEMYHLNSTNFRTQWDNLDPNFGDWKRMEDQFSQIKKVCPKIEFVTISEAIRLFLDHNAPDIVALRTSERRISPDEYRYDLQFLGKDIEVSAVRPHFVAVKPPSYFVGRIARLEIWRGDEMIQRWDGVADYRDLAFKVIAASGYSMRLTLNG